MGAGEAPQEKPDLAQTFDLVFKGGTVVNQAGEGLADIGVRDGPYRRDRLDRRRRGGRDHRRYRPAHSPRRDRQPGAFPRARARAQGGSWRPAAGRRCWAGVTAVFEMPNTKPPTTSAEALAAKVAAATGRMHCDFAFFVGATRDNVDDLAELELQPGAAGVKVVHGLLDRRSSGRRRGDAGPHSRHHPAPRRLPFRGRGAAEAAHEAPARRRSFEPQRMARRRRPRSPRPSGCCGSPPRRASACTCCMSRPARRWRCSRCTRTSPRSR